MKNLAGALALALCMGLMPADPARAQEVYEGFDYPADATVAGRNGGAGWSNAWGSGAGSANHRNVVAGSLTYTGITPDGNKLQAEGSRVFRNFTTPLTTGTHYIRVLAQNLETGGGSYFGLALFGPNASDATEEKTLIGQGTGQSNWVINRVLSGELFPPDHPTTPNEPTYILTSSVPTTTQALLVLKLELVEPSLENPEGLDQVTFWVNPDLSQPEDVATAVGGQSYTTRMDFRSITNVRIGGGGSGDAGTRHYLDEIHVSPYPPFPHGRIAVEQPAETPLVNGESSTDFGATLISQPRTLTYTLRNTGTSDLTGLAVAVSGTHAAEFVPGTLSAATLAPGATTTFDVTFTPSALGAREADLTISSDDLVHSTFIVALAGQGAAPELVVEQPAGTPLESGVSETDFGGALVGAPVARTFTLRNEGPVDLTGLSAAVTGAHAGDFVPGALGATTLAAGATTTFEVTFTPSASGAREAELSIASNDPNSPFIVALTGAGSEPQLVVEQPAGTVLASGAAVDFGEVALGYAPAQLTFILRNVGGAPLTLQSPGLDGANAADFSVSTPAATVPPAGETTLTVTFAPTALGARSASLSIISDDADSPFVLALSGTGLGIYGYSAPVITPDTESPPPPADPVAVWDDNAAGLYDGLLRAESDGETLLGAIESLKISPAKPGKGAAATAKLRLNGRTVTLRGAFDDDGRWEASLTQKDQTVINLSLQLMRTTGAPEEQSEVIRGTVSWAGTTARADLPRAPYSNKSRAPDGQSGKFTLLLPAPLDRQDDEPGGDGWATVTISPAGAVKVIGALGDGVKFTESAFLSKKGEFSLFAELYKTNPKGKVGGKIVFREVPDVSDFDGKIQWKKEPGEALYPEGFTLERWAVGSRFVPPQPGDFILDALAPADPNAIISFWGSLLTELEENEAITRVASWRTNHQLTHFGPEKLTAKANKNTGALTGSYRSLAGGKPFALKGVVFQKQNLAGGVFAVANGAGLLRVKPDTGYPYPGSEDPGAAPEVATPAPAGPLDTVVSTVVPEAAGLYGGIFSDGSGVPIGALENFKLTATGAFTATLWHQGVKYAISGALDENGAITGLPVPGTSFTLDLQLAKVDAEGGSFLLRGALNGEEQTFDLDAQIRPVFASGASSPQTGAYTVSLPAPATADPATEPAGHGYGALKVSNKGIVSGSLVLADGSKTTFSGHVTPEGEWSFHRNLYGKAPGGYLAGKLTFRAEAGISHVDGRCAWVKKTAFTLTRDIVGSAYTKPATGRVFALPDTWYNAWARLEGVALADGVPSVSKAVTWDAKNKILYYGVDKLTLKCNAATGIVTGSYQDKARGINVKLGGALLQTQGLVPGHYLLNGQSGRFLMEPRS